MGSVVGKAVGQKVTNPNLEKKLNNGRSHVNGNDRRRGRERDGEGRQGVGKRRGKVTPQNIGEIVLVDMTEEAGENATQ